MKVWIEQRERPASAFVVCLAGCDPRRLTSAKAAAKTWDTLGLRKQVHASVKLGKADRAGSVLSKDGHVHYRSDGARVCVSAHAFSEKGAARIVRGLEAVTLRLWPEEALLELEGDAETSYQPYRRDGALFVRMTHERQSRFQTIEVGEHPVYGRMLFLDGETQIASSDEPLYSRSLVEPAIREGTKRVLILGGGDCGVLRQVLTHPVEQVVMIEIDEEVVEVAAEHFPQVVASSREDPRARLVFGDAFEFLEQNGGFDLIIYDLSDTPLNVEGKPPVFSLINAALAPGGRVAVQCSSGLPMFREPLKVMLRSLRANLAKVKLREVVIPSFLEQPWVFAFARKKGKGTA